MQTLPPPRLRCRRRPNGEKITMGIYFSCPHCGKQTHVDDQYGGTSGPCAGCGKTISIPLTSSTAPSPARGGGLSGWGLVGVVIAAICVVMLPVVAILILLLLPAVNAVREAARRNECSNQMRQIALAMQSYEIQYRCFPPAYIADENGKPMHSWRVLLLPYLDEQLLYEQYDFSQPWDSPGNLAVAEQVPFVYRCPSTDFAAPNETNYMVVSGPGMAFEGSRALSQEDFLDGISRTILVVESTGHVTWTEPTDLDANQMTFEINGGPGEIGSDHRGGIAVVVFADVHIDVMSENTSAEDVRAMCTRSGGEDVSDW
jgi:hypothetical protein